MKISFNKTDEQVELIKAMGSKNKEVAAEAQEAFATLIAPAIGDAYNQADTTSFLYQELPFNEDDDPSFPLELFSDVSEDFFTVWSQSSPEGLATNHIHHPTEEVKFNTYRLDSAASYQKKFARKARLNVVAKAIERIMQEVMVKSQRNAWSVVLAALAQAESDGKKHVHRSETADVLSLQDFNNIKTYFSRLNKSFAGGTPAGGVNQATDMIVSPEVMAQMRAFAYNPINTKVANNLTPTAVNNDGAGGVIALPEEERRKIFANAGIPEFYGVNLLELLEFGTDQVYNILFDEYSSGNVTKFDGSGGASFNSTSDEVLIIVDATKDFAWRAVAENEDMQSTFILQPDDQFTSRSEKIGFYGYTTEGRLITDTKALAGLVI